MKRSSCLVLLILISMLLLAVPRIGRGAGELSVMFEDAVEAAQCQNSPSQLAALSKFHPTAGDILFTFDLYAEGNACVPGGTEELLSRLDTVSTPTGGEALISMRVCDFRECAALCTGKVGQALEDCLNGPYSACHDTTASPNDGVIGESCATFTNARFVFDRIAGPGSDPDFPNASRIMFTMTQHDPPTECTGIFQETCDQDPCPCLPNLKLTHHCIHLFDDAGNIVKSINSAFVFDVR